MIDILILEKVKMIYTVSSTFIDTIRFFNPAIKIIALNKPYVYKKIPNYLPIPRMDLAQKAQADTTWKELLLFETMVANVENKKK